MGLDRHARSGIDTGETAKSNIHWIATLAGRVGVAIDRTLVYAGGGGAWMRETDTDFGFGESFTGSSTSTGITFLTGVEYMIDRNWSARIQYNFGSKDVALPTFPTISTQARLHSITAGVNFRFW
jgi:outer membrane immunogenic protein